MHYPKLAPFVFYSGAYHPRSYAPLGAWIKYGRYPDEVKVVARGPQWVHLRCPDRELLLTRTSLVSGGARPVDLDWDEFVPFSWTNSTSHDLLSMDRYMINYQRHVKQPKGADKDALQGSASFRDSANLRDPECTVDDRKTIFTDSGGFQLSVGVSEWVSPLDYARWADRNCDEGITLDIPIDGGTRMKEFEDEFLLRAARIQTRNTQIIQENTSSNFHLFNVAHGLGDLSSRFRDIIEEPDDSPTHGLCLGGVYHGNVLAGVSRVCKQILSPNHKQYAQYHILGVTDIQVLTALIRFAAIMRAKGATWTLSSDASTAVYSATNRTMHMQRAHYKNAERLMLGQAQAVTLGEIENPHRILSCSCPVCRTFKYTDILSHLKESIVPHTFILHNAYEIDRWTKQQLHYATVLDSAQYRELIRAQMGGGANGCLLLTRFVEMVADVGHAAAVREFSPYMSGILNAGAVKDESGGGLFEERGAPQNLQGENYWADRLDTILTRYEAYHNTGITPLLTTKKEDLVRMAKKVITNSAVVKAGQRKRVKLVSPTERTAGKSSHTKPGQRKTEAA